MNPALSPLLTDLYQLTMMQVYHDRNMEDEAVFELFFRSLPDQRDVLVACGLAQVLDYLTHLRFSPEEIAFLREDGRFDRRFLDSLATLRFTGAVHAMPEGTIFFANEPVIRITAPLNQAQLIETRLINIIQFQTLIASKAVRMKQAAPDKMLVDYGFRRAQGGEAGVLAARASYLAGFSGTATVLAGKLFGIPLFGTMAHSFIQAHDSEQEAFVNFGLSHPDNVVLLLDTYDTERAAKKVVAMANEFRRQNIVIKGVRLDSGDTIEMSRRVRAILDEGGLQDTSILVSGNLDEYILEQFRSQQAPVDGFGIGTKMTTSADLPYLDCCYKMVEYKGIGRRKLSKGKATWPGKKQVYRHLSPERLMTGDTLALADETPQGTPLLQQYMAGGKLITELPSLTASREYLLEQLAQLPPRPQRGKAYPVEPSPTLLDYTAKVTEQMLAGSER
ncbi:MAG: nicotinate phosphoribosyltransferase [Desulfopila sp.]